MSSRFSSLRTGPNLARRLARVDLGSLPDEQLLDYLQAEMRQLSQQQARVWAAMAEVGRRAPLHLDQPADCTPQRLFDLAATEIATELRVSKQYAANELDHADDLEHLPALAAALRAGQIDRTRAVVLLQVGKFLSEEHRTKLITELLPGAGAITAGTLRARAQRLAIALDPDWAERRYDDAVRQRRVVFYLADDGTVTMVAQNQSPEDALAAKARLTALARAAKRAGACATMDWLRSELSMGLLGPRFAGMREPELIAALVARFPKPAADESDAAPAEPSTAPASPEPAAKTAPPAPPAPVAPSGAVPSGVELRVGLASLMGLTDDPGEIPGTGAVIARVARNIAQQQRCGEWRFAIVDDAGRLLFDGITRFRPAHYGTGEASGGIVELHVPPHLLDPAFIEEHPAWAKLLTDLAKQYERRAAIVQDPAARLPGRPLRRRMEIKHRFCVFPGCRRPAADSQADHRYDHAKGGATLEKNLGPLCEAHHDLKTRWGWRLIKQDDQTYLWISPYGRRHIVTIEPVAPPLPDPPDWPDADAA